MLVDAACVHIPVIRCRHLESLSIFVLLLPEGLVVSGCVAGEVDGLPGMSLWQDDGSPSRLFMKVWLSAMAAAELGEVVAVLGNGSRLCQTSIAVLLQLLGMSQADEEAELAIEPE